MKDSEDVPAYEAENNVIKVVTVRKTWKRYIYYARVWLGFSLRAQLRESVEKNIVINIKLLNL